MSVTFSDPDNKAVYDQDYNHVGGGEEVNFANSNAWALLRVMGIADADSLSGVLDGEMFRKRVLIGLANVSSDAYWNKDEYDLERRLHLLLSAFKNSKLVCWG